VAFHRVTAAEIRQRFNESGLWDAALAGHYLIERRETDPDDDHGQPPGTISVSIRIFHKAAGGGRGTLVFRGHHYEDPDGTIRNRAQAPDPKWFRWEGETWTLGPPPSLPPSRPETAPGGLEPFDPTRPKIPPPGPGPGVTPPT
jgi:hypothetical protein